MSRIVIYTAILVSATFSQSLASWNSTISASNPLNWYRLDETSGPTAFDYGSQGLNGTYGSGANAPVRGATGLVGTAVYFDGNSRNIRLNGSNLNGDWSAEFILKKTGEKTAAELLRDVPLGYPGSHLRLEQYPNTHQVGFTESFVADRVFSPAVVAPVGQFVNLVFVKTAAEIKLYMNGALKGSNNSPVPLPRYQFGDTEAESPIAVVDEIVIYDRALSPVEIASHFAAIPEPSTLLLTIVSLAALATRRRKRIAQNRF